MARALNPEGDDKLIGSKGVKKVEFVLIIAEALYSLGYKKAGEHLEEESGIPFHSSVVSVFMQKVRDGKWDECVALLRNIDIHDENIIKVASFIILQQKFLELLEENNVMDALKNLRTEIAPLSIDNNSIHELSDFVLSPSQHALIGVSGQNLVKLKSRSELLEELQKLLPPSVMIPERRLLKLVEQALDLQRDACLFNNSSVAETSLYTDHQFGRDQIPCLTLQARAFYPGFIWLLFR